MGATSDKAAAGSPMVVLRSSLGTPGSMKLAVEAGPYGRQERNRNTFRVSCEGPGVSIIRNNGRVPVDSPGRSE